jgi:hypothetical protein
LDISAFSAIVDTPEDYRNKQKSKEEAFDAIEERQRDKEETGARKKK